METKSTDSAQYVEIGISGERYILRIEEIREIIKMQDMNELPNSKPYMKGVINLRGSIIPVVSLSYKFAKQELEFSRSTRIVVVNYKGEAVGIITDCVYRVTTLFEIQQAPEKSTESIQMYLSGIGRTSEGWAGILDLESILFDA